MIKMIMNKFRAKRVMDKFSKQFRAKNEHNFTYPKNIFILDNVNIGKATYGPIEVLDYGNKDAKVRIGSFCSIANGVKFLSGGGHHTNHLSTYPFKAYFTDTHEISTTKGETYIGDDCWIGLDSIILSGATIPQGCIIGAGSVVRGGV